MPRGDFFREKKKQSKAKNKKNPLMGSSNPIGAPTLILPKVIGKNKKER